MTDSAAWLTSGSKETARLRYGTCTVHIKTLWNGHRKAYDAEMVRWCDVASIRLEHKSGGHHEIIVALRHGRDVVAKDVQLSDYVNLARQWRKWNEKCRGRCRCD